MGCFVYMMMGSCKDVPMGPTAISALLTYQASDGVWQKAVLLSFLTGIIEIIMGMIGLGFLLNFVSGPVNSGFTSAAAVIILTSQIKDVLGIKAKGSTFVEMCTSIFQNIPNTRMNDLLMGLSCLIILLLMRWLVKFQIGPKDDHLKSNIHKIINKLIWLIGTARNAILVVLTSTIAYVLHRTDQGELQIVGSIPSGMPKLELPSFSLPEIVNETTGEILQQSESFGEIIGNMGSSLIVIPLIALLENISVCKAFGKNFTFLPDFPMFLILDI